MSRVFPGRLESVGVGKETTNGTAVAPAAWQQHLALTLDQKTTQVQNSSALGRLENINDSQVAAQWAEGSLQGKVTDLTIGYFLMNLFGQVSPALHAGETTVYDNTFSVNNTTVPPTLTIARVNPNVSRRYALAEVTDFELDIKAGDWATFTASLMSRVGATASDTPAYVAENEFTSKHTTVKYASTVAGLSSGTTLDVKSVKLKITSKVDRYVPFGALDPTSFDQNDFEVTGELVLRYNDTSLETLGLANTREALSITLKNTDTTIGTSTNPSLTFTMPKVRFSPITLDNNLNQVLNQTVAFTAELDTTAGYMLQALLTNTKNGY